MDDKETRHRRARLRELIEANFDGLDINLIKFIEHRIGKRVNQGELSAIQKDDGKSFGDKKARTLTEQIGLNRRWFDMALGTNLDRKHWMDDEPGEGRTFIQPSVADEAASLFDQYRQADAAQQAIVDVVLGGKKKAPAWMAESTLLSIQSAIRGARDQSPDTTKKSPQPSARKSG